MHEINRREFIAIASLLGVGGVLAGCSNPLEDEDDGAESAEAEPDERVLVIGAGVAGMSAGHLLAQRGIDFQILEAASIPGGRVKRTDDFVDFPIPLGAEWLHAAESTLAQIVNDGSVIISQQMRGYLPSDPVAEVIDGELVYDTMGTGFDDLKFVGSTWLDFFDEYIVPNIADRMVFDTQIVAIDHGGDMVTLTDAEGGEWVADRVILTVPMKILQDGDIEFTPGLPESHVEALDRANIWTGMKVFLEFDEAFYPVFVEAGDGSTDEQWAYYDAAYGQESDANVLGLFVVGESAHRYQELDPGDELRDFILAELDALFDGAASRTYIQHTSQNWKNEPFVRAAYLADNADSDISQILGQNIGPHVFMAGCSYTRSSDWSSVHTAVKAASDAIEEMFP